jgi:hypothetical protein
MFRLLCAVLALVGFAAPLMRKRTRASRSA